MARDSFAAKTPRRQEERNFIFFALAHLASWRFIACFSPAILDSPGQFRSIEPMQIYAPWRMDYIKTLGQKSPNDQGKCFLCEAAAASDTQDRRQRLVLWQTDLMVVLLNRYPYANGHLLVAPKAHRAEMEELTDAELTDLGKQTTAAIQLLKRAVSAQGFNVGINLGRVAGAGLPGHLHQHVVPRWGGDINFMHIVGEVSVVPQTNDQLYDELMRVRAERS
jgi:ATP adenylyltransferase